MKLIQVLVIIIIFILIYKLSSTENFGRISGKWCDDCTKKSFGQCMDCFNCGFCLTESNKGYCTKGTVFGPNKMSEKCNRWIHNDDYITMMHLKNTTNEVN